MKMNGAHIVSDMMELSADELKVNDNIIEIQNIKDNVNVRHLILKEKKTSFFCSKIN